MNNIIFMVEIILISIILLFLFKKYKKEGLYIFIFIATIISNMMLLKTVEIFSIEVNLGLVIDTIIFIGANIITQKYGPDEVIKLIRYLLLGSFVSIIMIILFSNINSSILNQVTNSSYDYINKDAFRIYLANILAMSGSLWFNNILYYQLRKIKNKIYISNILSTIIVQFIESIIFITIAYFIKLSFYEILQLIVGRYILKSLVGIIATPIIYIANEMK